MRTDAVNLEDERLEGLDLDNYPWYNERHRIFPKVFKEKTYNNILDLAAGIGIVAKRINDNYDCFMLCNDISKNSLINLKRNKLDAISFDLDLPDTNFPLKDESFDAVISLATVEHIINLKKHLSEIWRILTKGGHLYISAPNYSGIQFYFPFLISGKTFHSPLKEGLPKYEFYAHVRYFTYKTLIEYIPCFGFEPLYAYLPLPESSTRYIKLKQKSKFLAFGFRNAIRVFYRLFSPRWAMHPVLCFSKIKESKTGKLKKPKKILV